jgi:hypothetical protein
MERIPSGSRKLQGAIDEGLDQIDTFRVAGARDRIDEGLD